MKISIGPPIEHGFYYDFDFPDGVTVTEADFPAIEERMREHIAAAETFDRSEATVDEALERFRGEQQDYKVELIEDLVKGAGRSTVSLYRNGPFTDLCRGPHAPTHRQHRRDQAAVRRRRLLARRREPADADRASTAPRSSPRRSSTAELERLEQARARDHRKLGRELEPLHVLRGLARLGVLAAEGHGDLERARRAVARDGRVRGFTEVKTPQLYDSELWKTSGHWGKYRENMFIDGDRGPTSSA